MKNFLVLVLAFSATPLASAQEDAAERARIAGERAAAEARFTQRQRECNALFAVNDCVSKATREKNAALANLRRQEQALDQAERRRSAAERLEAQQERFSPERQREEQERRARALEDHRERQERAAEKAAKRPPAASGAPAANEPKAPPQPQGQAREPRNAAAAQVSAEEAARNRAAFEQRVREAEEHKAEVRERIAKRAKPAASGLPVPK
ncbi:MAG: hypothetical protein EOO30_12580 [Comamonadaceae bacterium]|nr:MAG: hypothetical protein EOO30_12580 [Comamonadaceae bacterium]